jgi:aryl-alcohol dehydrogenase-like predicted oxidoreductase
MYNAITRSLEHELIPACKRYGLDVVVYNPIAGGLFSGKYRTSEIPKEGRYSDAVGRMGEMYRKRYFKDSTFEALQIIEPVVAKHGLTMYVFSTYSILGSIFLLLWRHMHAEQCDQDMQLLFLTLSRKC